MPIVIPATGELVLPALGVLFGGLTAAERGETIRSVLEEVRAGRMSLEHLLVVREGDRLRAVGWVIEQPGRTAYLYPPVFSDRAVMPLLMTELCRRLDAAGVLACQCLSPVDDDWLRETLQPFGFRDGGRMTNLARDLTKPVPELPQRSVVPVRFAPRWLDRFARLVERTYIESLDFPELGRVRGGRNALEAHAAVGTNSEEWWLFQEQTGGPDVAILLMADVPSASDDSASSPALPKDVGGTTELVYLGVDPTARGRGWGRWLVHQALARCRRRRRLSATTSVIDVNIYAKKIYASLGFEKELESQVFLRISPDPGMAVMNNLSTSG